jgi:hypothetical protein
MVFQIPQFWEIAGDGFQILLCLLMLGFFIKNRAVQKKKNAFYDLLTNSKANFNAHVFHRTVEQQINQAFVNIIDTITVERSALEPLFGRDSLNYPDDDTPTTGANTRSSNHRGNQRLSDNQSGNAERYEDIRELGVKGLSARKISRTLKIPISEVELVLSLQGK